MSRHAALPVSFALAIATASWLHAQSSPQAPTFRGTVNTVRVDVNVTDGSDHPVLDLHPEDFELREDGKLQKIETFKLISLDGGRVMSTGEAPRPIRSQDDEREEAARDDVRIFAFFLDDYHVTWENSVQVREHLGRFVMDNIGPSDLVAIMTPMESIGSVVMTRDHDAVRRALLAFTGRKRNYMPINDMEARYALVKDLSEVERIRRQVSFGALKALILKLGGLKDGRKALMLVSEGFLSVPPPDPLDPRQNPPLTTVPTKPPTLAGIDDPDLRELYELANRYNVSINSVDPRGMAASEFPIDYKIPASIDNYFLKFNVEVLKMLADYTNGRAVVERNDYASAMKQIVIDSSAYYLLGFTSASSKPDGKYHELRVGVKRRGIQVRARPGYWALRADDAKRLSQPETSRPPSPVETALAGDAVASTRAARTWIGMARADSGRTRVQIVMEPNDPSTARRATGTAARIIVTAVAVDGTPIFRENATSTVSFDTPPGTIRMQLVVESDDGRALDSETREVVVPDFTTAPTAMATPQVFRARTVADVERIRNDRQATPTAARAFGRAERLVVKVPVYHLGDAQPELRARLVNRSGQAMSTLPVRNTPEATVEVVLASLAPGEYGLELTASGEGGSPSALVEFRVTP